jgi:hypothetical protein
MIKYPSTFFDFNVKYDFLKKSLNTNIQKTIFLNKKKISVHDLKKKASKRNIKLKAFWSLELITLKKAFLKYKFNKSRKSFYSTKGVFSDIKRSNTFLTYNFMKNSLCSIPYLKVFFDSTNLRNLKMEILPIFDFLTENNKIFHNITSFFYLTLKENKSFQNTVWLSLYKAIL